MRVLFIIALAVTALGAYPDQVTAQGTNTFRFYLWVSRITNMQGGCTLYNLDYPGGLAIEVPMTASEQFNEPATIVCDVEGTAPKGFWTISTINATFEYTTPETSYIDWSKVWFDWQTQGYMPESGTKTPNSIGFMEVSTKAEHNWQWPVTISLSFTAVIGGGYAPPEPTPCAEAYAITEILVDANDIYPYVEVPLGPTPPAPNSPDEMIVTLVPGLLNDLVWVYKLATDGGWYDDGDYQDNSQYEISLDGGITWEDLNEMETLCVDSTGWVFQTDADELRIRANDISGEVPSEFLDNTPDEPPFPTYSLYHVIQIQPLTCADKFTYDPDEDFVAAGIIYADNLMGYPLPPEWPEQGELIPGEWYVLETVQGPWYNAGDPSYEIAVDLIDTIIDDQVEFGEWEYTDCWEYVDETETNKRYFFQAPENAINVFVHDPGLVFTDNTERISYLLARVPIVEYWPTACEKRFVIGDEFSQHQISATASAGHVLGRTVPPLLPGEWYVLETANGPWRTEQPGHENARYSWDMDVARGTFGDEPEFHFLPEWPDAACVAQIDKVGHYRVYFQVPSQVMPGDDEIGLPPKYTSRVSDGDDEADYATNQGFMTVILNRATLAQVVPPGTPPREGACDGLYQKGEQRSTATIVSTSSLGIFIPGGLQPEEIYALETANFWEDGGPGELTMAQISDDNGANWYDWHDYPSALCVESYIEDERAYTRLYIRVNIGDVFKVRADDSDGIWLNNVTNQFKLKVFSAQMLYDPWNSCQENYSLTEIPVPPNLIRANQEDGVRLPAVEGNLYAIEIHGGDWNKSPSDTDRYDAALSVDSGANYHTFSDRDIPGFQCYAKVGVYEWVYFTAQDGYSQIRVNDNGDFTDNSGELEFRFYSAVGEGSPGDPVDPPGPPDTYIGCYTSNSRPAPFRAPTAPSLSLSGVSGFEDLVDLFKDLFDWLYEAGVYFVENSVNYFTSWIAYTFGSLVSFFLWCPEHTAGIKAILGDIATLEPYATIRRGIEFGELTAAQIDSYEWSMDNGAGVPFSGVSGGVDVPSLIPAMADTPFGGGDFAWSPIQGGGSEPITSCRAKVVYRWGSENPLVIGYCAVLNIMKMTGLNVILNIGIVVSALFGLFNYFRKRWVMTIISLITGGNFIEATGGTTKVEIERNK